METTHSRRKATKLIVIMFVIAFLTAIGSEVKILPFENIPFRFGLGSIIFFFALIIKRLPIFTTGFVTACIVVLWRTIWDVILYDASFITPLIEHLPAGLFYIVFALCFHFISLDEIKQRPFTLGFCATAFEVIANTIEHIATGLLLLPEIETSDSFLLFVLVGLLRSFFVVGLYSIIILSEQKKQMHHLMAIHAELYVETLYLQKTMEQIELLTANSYQLYKTLKPIQPELSKEALTIAQEIHEIKKDHQRIYAGLSKITSSNYKQSILLSDLLSYIVEANENYAKHLNKSIEFTLICTEDFYTKEHIALLAILNNLMANAVEAIRHTGFVTLSVGIEPNTTVFIVEDNGVGIEPSLIPIIFDVGYTSKFNNKGHASTGIGLSHTKTIVENLQGTMTVTSDETTYFTIQIPTNRLKEDT